MTSQDWLSVHMYGGPLDGQTTLLPTIPPYVCLNMPRGGLSQHYRRIAGRRYEHVGACVEVIHDPLAESARCPECGGHVLGDGNR